MAENIVSPKQVKRWVCDTCFDVCITHLKIPSNVFHLPPGEKDQNNSCPGRFKIDRSWSGGEDE